MPGSLWPRGWDIHIIAEMGPLSGSLKLPDNVLINEEFH